MLLLRSRLAALTVDRPRLAPWWLIALLAGMVLVTLVAIYPHGDLVRRVTRAPSGPLTTAYLTALLRTDPGNPHLRLMLARSQNQSGQFAEVGQTVAPALASADAELRREAVWLLWQSEVGRLATLPPGKARDGLRTDLRQRLTQMIEADPPAAQLAQIARGAMSLGDTALGLSIFERLARSDPEHGDAWYREAARDALAQREYSASASLFLVAAARAATLEAERGFFLDALKSLAAGERIEEAAVAADTYLSRSARLAGDTQALIAAVQTARAARRPDLADKYARQLLRLSLLEQWRQARQMLAHFGARPQRAALKGETLNGGPELPFNDRIYTLGFEAFLDNKKLDDAWKVAASAVRQAPDSLVWRERLAKVSEWSGRPRTALENWRYLARTTGSEEAWQAVLRLAPGLFDDAALRDALLHTLDKRPGDPALIRQIAATYERLGDPAGALLFLGRQRIGAGNRWILREMAEIAERQGDDRRALNTWLRFVDAGGLDVPVAMHVATLRLLDGRPDEALALLRRAAPLAGDGDTAFWRLSAQIAQERNQDGEAVAAYRRAMVGPEALESDFDAAYGLLLDRYPREAAKIAAAAWRRFGTPAKMVQALSAYASVSAFAEMGALLGEIPPARLAVLRQQPDFLRLSAAYQRSRGAMTLARRDLEQALAISPGDPDSQQALFWLLVDTGDGAGVRRALDRWEPVWRGDPRLHDTLAAGYLALSLPDIALKRYLTPQLQARREDFLWLMNYADALEQNGEADRAWRLRQGLLADLGRKTPARQWLTADEAEEMRGAARARLVIAQRPGDPAYAILRELLRLDRDAAGKLSENAAIVATAWLQNAGETSAERGWLWQRFARSAARPIWAEISVALAEDDRETAGRLLERNNDALPRHDRVNAARRVDDVRLAQTSAFETQGDQPADDELHLQLTEALLAHSHHAGFNVEWRNLGGIQEDERAARWHFALTPRLALDFSLGDMARKNTGTAAIRTTPDERFRTATLTWQHRDGVTRMGVESRDSFADFTPLWLEHEQRIDNRLSLTAALGRHLPASDSSALRLGGMRDRLALGLNYRPTQRDGLGIEVAGERYRTQTGIEVGNGRHLQLECRHALLMGGRDLEASAFWSAHRYGRRIDVNDAGLLPLMPIDFDPTTQSMAAIFIPENFRFYGIRLSTDTRFEREYTRAWRPYGSVALTRHSTLGSGYELFAGAAGSVLGADHLRLGWSLSKGGARDTGGLTRQFGLSYRLHY
ncbi:MAG: tetratricopeptide repeat protein [Betaproteobacteria bacterium]